MENGATNTAEANLSASMRELINDTQRLVEQRIDLLRHDLRDELQKIREAGLSLGAGAGMAAVGGILSGFMLVHLLQRITGLPLWACYGLVAAGLGGAGGQLLVTGASKASEVEILPQPEEVVRKTAQAVKESTGVEAQ